MNDEIKKIPPPETNDSESIEIGIGDKKIKGRWYRLTLFILSTFIVLSCFIGFLAVVIKIIGIQFDAFGVKINK